MTLEIELISAGFAASEVRRWSIPKINWLAGLLHKLKCNNTLLNSLAARDPKRLMELRDECDRDPIEISDDWEPPSLDRIKRNMERYGSKG